MALILPILFFPGNEGVGWEPDCRDHTVPGASSLPGKQIQEASRSFTNDHAACVTGRTDRARKCGEWGRILVRKMHTHLNSSSSWLQVLFEICQECLTYVKPILCFLPFSPQTVQPVHTENKFTWEPRTVLCTQPVEHTQLVLLFQYNHQAVWAFGRGC